jgi:molybdopterin molybdotransferase
MAADASSPHGVAPRETLARGGAIAERYPGASMRPFKTTLPLDEALAILREAIVPIDRVERAALDEAAGRVLAQDVVAAFDVPPFDRAAMDGYAVRSADTADASSAAPVPLSLAGMVYTGQVGSRAVGPGECIEIATGAPVPPGADAVVMVEDTTRTADGRTVHVGSSVRQGQHVSPRGHDIAVGQTVLRAGAHLTPARLGACAALGRTTIEVYARPRVLIASTGNEIVEPGQPPGPGQIHDINRLTLPAVVRAHGGTPCAHPAVADTLADLRTALDAASDADLIVLSGGSSVGERDLLVDAVRERGEVLFHGIAVKPGKPTLLARIGARLLLGMPGNPTSCLSNAYILLVPLLRALARLPAYVPETRPARLARTIVSAADRHQFYPVRIDGDAAEPAFRGSGDITSLALADGYIEIPIGVDRVAAGTVVTVTLF